MLALRFDPRPRLDTEAPEPAVTAGEAVIALRMAGICDTDLQLARGFMGFRGIPGHEFVGEVIACDDATWLGRRVVGDINAGCGTCADCLHGDGHHCATRTVLGIVGRSGCLSERFLLPTRNLVALPDVLEDELAVFAEPLAAGLHVLDEVRAAGAKRVAVLGDGKLGLLTALAVASEGVDVTLIGHHQHKLDLARAAGVAAILEHDLDGAHANFDLVVEATGNAGGLKRALELVRPRGTVVLKTTVADPLSLDLSPVVVNELRLIGSRCGDMTRAVQKLARNEIDPRPLIAERFELRDVVRALECASQRGQLKVLVHATRD